MGYISVSKRTQSNNKNDIIQETYSWSVKFGLIFGSVCLIMGFILIVMGLTGNIELVIQGGNINTKVANASPGIVLCILGLVIILYYKPKIKQKKSSNGKTIEIIAMPGFCSSSDDPLDNKKMD